MSLCQKTKLEIVVDSVPSKDTPITGEWLSIEDVNTGRPVTLSVSDKAMLLNGGLLNDCHITFAQQLLLQQFPGTKGLQSTLFIDKMASSEAKIDHGVQIIHDRTNHWIVASNMKHTGIEIYDSLYTSVNALTHTRVTNIFQPIPDKKPRLKVMKMQKQVGAQDCGLFAVAIATAILFGHDTSVRFNQKIMRPSCEVLSKKITSTISSRNNVTKSINLSL